MLSKSIFSWRVCFRAAKIDHDPENIFSAYTIIVLYYLWIFKIEEAA